MIDLRLRDMELTAELVEQRIRQAPLLQELEEAGRPAQLGYTHRYVWIESGELVLSKFLWPDWWVPGLATREDHAAEVAHYLIIDAGRGHEI